MASPAPQQSPEALTDLSLYTRWPEILRSWFWRFYDHLLKVILCNFCWAALCTGLAWAAFHFDWVGIGGKYNYVRFYLLFLAESILSVGWAFLIFKLFTEGDGALSDVWPGTKLYFFKAIGLSAVSGALICLSVHNILFYFKLHGPNRMLELLPAAFVAWILLFWLTACLYQWPVLFFQNPPFFRILYRSCLLALGNSLVSLGTLALFAVCLVFFTAVAFLWFFIGFAFFFSYQCVVLEKLFLRYKIIYKDKPLEPFLEQLDAERRRGWKDFLRPWES